MYSIVLYMLEHVPKELPLEVQSLLLQLVITTSTNRQIVLYQALVQVLPVECSCFNFIYIYIYNIWLTCYLKHFACVYVCLLKSPFWLLVLSVVSATIVFVGYTLRLTNSIPSHNQSVYFPPKAILKKYLYINIYISSISKVRVKKV